MFLFFFFFKQKTAYEIMPSLVGSEMCIRDRAGRTGHPDRPDDHRLPLPTGHVQVEQDRTPPLQSDLDELAWPATDQPRGHRQPDRRNHDPHRPESHRRARRDHLPQRHQDHRPRDGRPRNATPHQTRLPRRVELQGESSNVIPSNAPMRRDPSTWDEELRVSLNYGP